MPESKNMPQVKRLQGGVVIPYNVQQVTRTNEDNEQEAFYKFNCIKLDQQNLPSLNNLKKHIVQQFREDLHTHVFVHYDLGSQSSINGLAQRADRQGKTDILDECEAILSWINQCLNYYYTKKDAILTVTDETGLTGVVWDFEANCPKPDTLKSLRELWGMF